MTIASRATVNLAEPYMRNIGTPGDRHAQRDFELKLPPGTTVVSADGHWELNEDIFYQNFPAHLKDEAPRVWFDRFWHIGYKGEVEAFPLSQRAMEMVPKLIAPGLSDLKQHCDDLTAEGVDIEICFPQSLFAFVRYPNPEVQETMYRVYNEYMAKVLHEKSGRRIFPVGIFANWWDPEAAERSMRQLVDLGIRTFMIPLTFGYDSNGKPQSYADPEFDRFWAVVEEAGLPVSLHVGEGLDLAHRGGVGATTLTLLSPFRKHFGQLVFGGVFDRHPKLKVIFVEAGASWVPPALQDAEMVYDTYAGALDPIEHRPSHYWHNNCYAVLQSDRLALRQLDIIGADRVMWAGDYPHGEGTYGFGRAALQVIADTVTSPDDTRAILGGTAMDLFKLKA